MIQRILNLLVLLLCFQLSMGHSSDSIALSDMLKKGRDLEPVNKEEAMDLYRVILARADSAGMFNTVTAEICDKLANYEYYRGNTEVAVTLALRALTYYESQPDPYKTTMMMVLVGDILRGNELFDQSYSYLLKAYDQAHEQKDSSLLANVCNRIAALGIDDTRISQDTTEWMAKRSLAIARVHRNELMIYNNLNILGVLENIRRNYSKSLVYLNEAHAIARISFPEDEPLILHNMARNYYALGNSSKAVELDKEALLLAQKFHIPQYIRLSSSFLKDYYIANKNYQEGLKYTIQYYQAKDLILTQKVLVQVKEFNNRIETEKQRLENQRLIYEQKLTDGRSRNYLIIGILLLILLLLSTGFMLYQRRQRHEIRKIASRLEQSNRVLTRFISVLGHDLRSPFNAILGFTDLLKNEPMMDPGEKQMAIDRLYTVSRSTYKLLERILEWSRLQSGSVKPNMKPCDLSELVGETIHMLEPAALLKKIVITYHYQGPLPIVADENMVLTVVRNILSNAIKFSYHGGRIDVGSNTENQKVVLYIKDQGVGISRENLDKLFQLDSGFKSQGTAGESGTGLGLILCREYLAMHGGALEVTSEENEGSTFTITLP